MAELLSPGVFIEEVPTQLQTITGVSTSNMGTAGYAQRGPENEATLVTSLNQYSKIFGPFVPSSQSFMGLSLAAFFSNGGRRAYVVRVCPGDATEADCKLRSWSEDQEVETTAAAAEDEFWKFGEAGNVPFTPLRVAGGLAPVAPGTVSFKWRSAGTAVSTAPTKQIDGSTDLVCVDGQADYAGEVSTYWSQYATGGAAEGDIVYIAKTAGPSSITIEHVGGVSQVEAVTSVVGDVITIQLGTDAGGLVTSTPNTLAATIAAHGAASALIDTYIPGLGTGIMAVQAATGLTGLPVYDDELDRIVGNGSITLDFSTVAGGAVSLSFAAAPGATRVLSATAGSGADTASASLDLRTGKFSITTTGTFTPAAGDTGNITASYTPASATHEITDDGAGNLIGDVEPTYATTKTSGTESVGPNTINYSTGAYNFQVDQTPTLDLHVQGHIVASYYTHAWDLDPISKGTWGNDLLVEVKGNVDSFTIATHTYSKYDVNVYLYDSDLAAYSLVETFEEVDFSNSSDAQYMPDVINELSDYINVATPGSDLELLQLEGQQRYEALDGGSGAATQQVAGTLANVPGERSVTITYTSGGATKTITDDGLGNLEGDVDAAGTNTISYTSGAYDFTTSDPIDGGTIVVCSYYDNPSTTTQEEFGDSTKNYTAGTDGTFDSTNYGRSQFTSPTLLSSAEGIYALDRVDEIFQVVLPDFAGDLTVTGDLLDYAATRAALPSGGDRFILLTPPLGSSPQEAVNWFRYQLGRYSDFAAIYWPWIKVADPLANNRPLLIPNMGHIAGIYARTDTNKNVGKAPAGTVDGQLQFLLDLEYNSTQGERDLLYPNKINPLVSTVQTGKCVWGARTISNQGNWKNVNARRLFMFLEKSVYNDTFWIIFENNGPGLWARIQAQLNGWLNGLFNDGYFAGSSPTEAYFVVCDDTNNDASTIEAGQVIVDVGVAVNKPAEFARFRFQQKALSST